MLAVMLDRVCCLPPFVPRVCRHHFARLQTMCALLLLCFLGKWPPQVEMLTMWLKC